MGERDDIIETWKDIAEALGGVSVRTAQRYRDRHGLKVEGDVSGVYIRRSVLERWLVATRSRRAA